MQTVVTASRGRSIQLLVPAALLAAGLVMAAYGANLNGTWSGIFLRDCILLAAGTAAEVVVILIGGIDLSIGANSLVVTLAAAKMLAAGGVTALAAIPSGLTIATLIGLSNGLIVWFGGGAPFIVTLGTTAVLQGIALTISASAVTGIPRWFGDIYAATIGPIPICVIGAIAALTGFAAFLRLSSTGRALYAIGGNARAARWAGINTRRVTLVAYSIAGFFAGLAGLFVLSEDRLGNPGAGQALAFAAIAAAAVGGVSLYGGRGRVSGMVGGVVLLTGLITLSGNIGISSYYQELIQGLVILAGAAFSGRL